MAEHPFGLPQAGDFHCARCGTLLDGGTDEPVAARELRAALRTMSERVMSFGGIQRTERGNFWISRDDVLRLIDEVVSTTELSTDQESSDGT